MANNYEFEEEDFNAQFNGKTLARILTQLKPHWKMAAGFLILVGCVALLDGYFTFLAKRIVDEGILVGNLSKLTSMFFLYGGLIVVQALCVLGFIYLVGVLGERVQYDMRKKMFNHLQELSFSYFDRTPVGWIMTRVSSDSERIAGLITWGLLDCTYAALSISTALVFMLYINWQLALMVLAVIPILLIVAVQFKTRILVQFRLVRKINSKITGAYNENITGVRVIKALCREEENLKEFSVLTSDMYKAAFRAAWLSALFLPIVQIITAFAVGAIIYYSGWSILNGRLGALGMTIGGIQAFIGYVTMMIWPISDVARIYAEMQHAIASAERVFSLIDSAPDVTDKPDAIEVPSVSGDIAFDHVEFYYEKGKAVLQDFSLTVRRGETIALVGPTGGGKSTIVNLVCRFYEPKSGTISIGGQDYTGLSLHAIQSHIGVVLQTPHLFSGTVRENLRYGRLDATDAEIEDAAKLAGAHDFIVTLDKGYDAEVGEGGNLLSVGQKQLISLARAVLARPEIFIMDEATSSVDTLTEALIQRGMETLMQGCTSFVIAHRLSTIRRADRILVIHDGRIAEMGSHADLLRERGEYYRLYTQQFRHELETEFDPFGAQTPAVTPEAAAATVAAA
jgi:ATP-binding cassette, subfamily B, bacterial